MSDAIIKILREFGLPTLVAVAFGALLYWQLDRAADERDRWLVMMEYVMDTRAECKRAAP